MTIDIDAEASAGRISAEAFRNLELAEANGQRSRSTSHRWCSRRSTRSPQASSTPCGEGSDASSTQTPGAFSYR